MTRVLWIFGVALTLSLRGLAAEQAAAEKADTPKCTLATLKGRYLFGGIASLLPPVAPEQQQLLLAAAGYHVFNGDGTGKDIVSASINGQSVEDRAEYDITYTVKPDCSGTYTVPAAGLSLTLFVAPDGEELIVIATTPGFVLVQGPNKRVSPK